MQDHYHAVVWIDHKQARIFHFNAEDADGIVVKPEHPVRDYHRKERGTGKHDPENQKFLEDVTRAIADAGAVLICGPSTEKHELVKHIEKTHPRLLVHIEGVESVDHPTDAELVAYARRYAKAADRMKPLT